jgi:16S rRNA (guanine527-N7)-methyltransferase
VNGGSDSRLEALLAAAGIAAPLRGRLARYGELVLETNRRFNLTGAKTTEQLLGHLLDSLTVLPYISEPYVDIGAGAGFPAIPVALATGLEVTLIEATAKKAGFLASLLERLDLRGRVVAQRAELAAHDPELRERFGSGTARGVATAPAAAELVIPFIRPGGFAVMQRGGLDAGERIALEDASLVLGAKVEAEFPLPEERRIVLVRKLAATPARFPRRVGVPGKRPLCS